MRDLTSKAIDEYTAEDVLWLAQANRLTPELMERLDMDNVAAAMRGEEALVWEEQAPTPKAKKKAEKKAKKGPTGPKGQPLVIPEAEDGTPLSPVSGAPLVPKHAPEHGVVHVTREGSIMDKMPEDLYDVAWTNDHLRHECHIRGLSMDGRKDSLIARITQFDELLEVADKLKK